MKTIYIRIRDCIEVDSTEVRTLSKLERLLWAPVMLIWFLFQCLAFWLFMGGLAVILGLTMSVASLFEKGKYDYSGLGLTVIAIISPILWWVRYFKYGAFNTLIVE